MKSRLLIIIGFSWISLIIPSAYSMCMVNDDWSDAPCFDMGPVSKLEYQLGWMPYYDHKGSEWMENKKI